MQNLGIRLLVLSYCCMGCVLGELVRSLASGRTPDLHHDGLDLIPFTLLGNFLGLSALVLFLRRGIAEPAIDSFGQTLEVLFRGASATNRITFFLCTMAWVIGLLLGELFAK